MPASSHPGANPEDVGAEKDKGFPEISILDLLALLYRRRRLLIGITALGTVLSLATAVFSPYLYTAKSKVVPSNLMETSSEFEALGGLRGAASQFGFNFGGSGTNLSLLFPDLLSSHDLTARLLTRTYPVTGGGEVTLLDFLKVKKGEPQRRLERAVSRYSRRLVQVLYDPRTGMTSISATFRDPQLAAAVVNASVEELNHDIQILQSSQAGDKVRFVARRISEVQDSLATAEENLEAFREHNRVTAGSPELMLEESRLNRQVTIYEQLFLTLKGQYEVARIEQFRNLANVTVLEKASPPLFRSSPRRFRTVVLGAVGSGFLALVAAFALELGLAIYRRLRPA